MSNVVICLLKMRAVMSFAECIGPSLRTAHVVISVLYTHVIVTKMCMKRPQVTHLMRCSGTVQLAAAACSMDVLRVWGRYELCLLLLLYCTCLAGNTCIVTNLPLLQGGFFRKVL